MSTLKDKRAARSMTKVPTASDAGKKRRSGNQWRGRIPVPKHCHPLVQQLIAEMNRQRTTLTEVGDRAGIDRGTISDWRYRRAPRVDLLEAALNVIGFRLAVVEDDRP